MEGYQEGYQAGADSCPGLSVLVSQCKLLYFAVYNVHFYVQIF